MLTGPSSSSLSNLVTSILDLDYLLAKCLNASCSSHYKGFEGRQRFVVAYVNTHGRFIISVLSSNAFDASGLNAFSFCVSIGLRIVHMQCTLTQQTRYYRCWFNARPLMLDQQ